MKYVIDRIEGNIALLENVVNKEKKEVYLKSLPKGIQEGNVVIVDNNKYIIDNEEEIVRRERIMEKFNKLKR